LSNLGILETDAGATAAAIDLFNRAIALDRELKDRWAEACDRVNLAAARIRADVNGALHARVAARMSDTDAARRDALLELDPRTRRTAFDELKRPAGAATVSRLREHLAVG